MVCNGKSMKILFKWMINGVPGYPHDLGNLQIEEGYPTQDHTHSDC